MKLLIENWRNYINEEMDADSGMAQSPEEWVNEYGEKIARLFIDNGAYGLFMAENISTPPEFMNELKKIMSKVAKLLAVAETSNFRLLRPSYRHRPERYVLEIREDFKKLLEMIAPTADARKELVDLMGASGGAGHLQNLAFYGEAANRGLKIPEELVTSFDEMKKWVGDYSYK
tara:strand:- start:998 stop:1519 length:522 start_codon:yes stop_codon:yes gene_type:complete